ncbi:acylneuraminate cytidylyltransferase family protein [Psychrobacillus psychrodurans]|uniref:acylneuraminate cytidylyltransferase family protein n=1 Tax=Psychrobacillus psychrodurans TaxID=126157 RepID=UPI001F4D4513|nr:acylneuraminate cytidylyltransferase family protein [Psychrobacillus psychrodurans]MCK1995984.1 acylneuraminate cytidylyltransferase family protein [Psychrobacillus psychrodurans]
MSRICTICARGGSKGVKNKNTKLLIGKPLIAHSIEQAKQSGLFDTIAVSSDSKEILAIAKQYGADILVERPFELATDQAAKLPVIQHCLSVAEEKLGKQFNVIVDMDATSPLRLVEDIIKSVQLFENNMDVDNLITGAPSRRSPYFNLVEVNEEGYAGLSKKLDNVIVRRQDAPKCYDMNASIYIWKREILLNSTSVFQSKTLLYEMPEDRSIDIDSELDFEFVSFLAMKRGKLS